MRRVYKRKKLDKEFGTGEGDSGEKIVIDYDDDDDVQEDKEDDKSKKIKEQNRVRYVK